MPGAQYLAGELGHVQLDGVGQSKATRTTANYQNINLASILAARGSTTGCPHCYDCDWSSTFRATAVDD
jgi:hypothetical protein